MIRVEVQMIGLAAKIITGENFSKIKLNIENGESGVTLVEVVKVINDKLGVDLSKIVREPGFIVAVNGREVGIEKFGEVKVSGDVKILVAPLTAGG